MDADPEPRPLGDERPLAVYREALTLTDQHLVHHGDRSKTRGSAERRIHLQDVTSISMTERTVFRPLWGIVPLGLLLAGVVVTRVLAEPAALPLGVFFAWVTLPLLRTGRGHRLLIGTPIDRLQIAVPRRHRKEAQAFVARVEKERNALAKEGLRPSVAPTAVPFR